MKAWQGDCRNLLGENYDGLEKLTGKSNEKLFLKSSRNLVDISRVSNAYTEDDKFLL